MLHNTFIHQPCLGAPSTQSISIFIYPPQASQKNPAKQKFIILNPRNPHNPLIRDYQSAKSIQSTNPRFKHTTSTYPFPIPHGRFASKRIKWPIKSAILCVSTKTNRIGHPTFGNVRSGFVRLPRSVTEREKGTPETENQPSLQYSFSIPSV